MRYALVMLAACGGGGAEPAPMKPTPTEPAPLAMWPVPDGWKSETIPFPLGFAPSLAHRGVEELRFAPKFFEPDAPGYWTYAFTWRTDDAAQLAPDALAAELTTYFKGLAAAVDEGKNRITEPDKITVRAVANGARVDLTATMFDVFKTAKPIELTGWAARTSCGTGALWVFVLAPATSPLRAELETLAAKATCGQPVEPPKAP